MTDPSRPGETAGLPDHSTDDVLPAGDLLSTQEPLRQRNGRRGLVVGSAVVGGALVAGSAFALTSFLSGGGVQPEDVLPASVAVYADVDLDPAAGQKANIARFASHFADVDERLDEPTQIRSVLLDVLLDDADFEAAEVEPWLGDRFGIALLVPEQGSDDPEPQIVLAVQVTDEAAATAWLTDQIDGEGTVTTTQGYALVGSPGVDLAELVAETAASPLAEQAEFASQMEQLGDGVASLYVDADAVDDLAAGLVGVVGQPLAADAEGAMSAVMRVEPDSLELVATSQQSPAQYEGLTGPLTLPSQLPGDTVSFAAVAGLGEIMVSQWDQLVGSLEAQLGASPIEQIEAETGLRLPDDLATLFGAELVVAVGGDDLMVAPQAGLRVVADPVESMRLVRLLRPLVADATGGYGLDIRATADGWVLASDPGYAQVLAAGGGDLGASSTLRETIPDLDQAAAAAFVDFGPIVEVMQESAAPDDESLAAMAHLRGLGVSVQVSGETADLRLRLTVE